MKKEDALLPGLKPIPRRWVEVDARSDFSSHYAEHAHKKRDLAQEYAKEDVVAQDASVNAAKHRVEQRAQYYLRHEDRFIERHVEAWHALANREWNDFTRQHSNNGANKGALDNLRKLYDIAFGSGLEKVLKRENIKRTGEYQADENGDMHLVRPDPRFEALRKPMEEICLIQSKRTAGKSAQPLNRALIAAIAHQWCEFRGDVPECKKNTEKTQYYTAMQNRRSEPAFALFCDLLYDLASQTYQNTALQKKKSAHYLGMDNDEFLQHALEAFFKSLYNYREGMGNSLTSWAIGNINFLISGMLRKQQRQTKLLQSTREEHLDIPTEKDPSSKHDRVDDPRRLIPSLMQEVLTDTEHTVLAGRFGLSRGNNGDNASPQTLEQLGNKLGLTKKRVRQIQNKALEKLRRAVEHPEHRGNGNDAPEPAHDDAAMIPNPYQAVRLGNNGAFAGTMASRLAPARPGWGMKHQEGNGAMAAAVIPDRQIPQPHPPAPRKETPRTVRPTISYARIPDSDLTACKKAVLMHFTDRDGNQMTISDIAREIGSLPGNLSFVLGPGNHSDPLKDGRMSDTVKEKLATLLKNKGKTPNDLESFHTQWETLKNIAKAKEPCGMPGPSH